MIPRLVRALAALSTLGFCLLSSPAITRADTVVILVSEDTSPYSFLPSLPRYNNPTTYAFRGVDEGEGSMHQFETFLWFDVSLADIPPGHVLTDARLLVTHSFDATGFGTPETTPAELNCHEVTEPWDQATLTWLNKPAFDAPIDSVAGITDFGPIFCDVWPVVFDWIHGVTPNEGFALTNDLERVIGLYSLEADPAISDSLKANLILTTELPEPGLGLGLAVGTLAFAARGSARSGRGREARRVGVEHVQ